MNIVKMHVAAVILSMFAFIALLLWRFPLTP